MKHYKEKRTCKRHGVQMYRVYKSGGQCPACSTERSRAYFNAHPGRIRAAIARYSASEKGKATLARYRAIPGGKERRRCVARAWSKTAAGKKSLAKALDRVDGRVCRWCGRRDKDMRFGTLATECAACHRLANPSRNGRHPCCREPIRKNKPHECKT